MVGDRTAKSRLSEMRVTESQFADDVALYATSRDSFESVAAEFVKVSSEWGLTVSTEKTKGMVVGEGLNESDVRPVQVESGSVMLSRTSHTWVLTSQEMGRSLVR